MKSIKLSFVALLFAGMTVFAAKALPKWFGEHPFITELVAKMAGWSEAVAAEKLYVQIDRTFFSPGEEVWFKAYIRDANSLKASDKSDVLYAELLSPKGSIETKLTLIATEGGAAGNFVLPATAAGGIWKVRVYTNWGKNSETVFERDITVQRVVLPHLNMKMEFERKAYGAGDEVSAKLDLNSLDNKPLANYPFSFVASVQGAEIVRSSGITDAAGHTVVHFKLPANLKSNDGLLNVLFKYQGQTESISRSVPIVLNKIDLQLLPEGGDMLAGATNKVAFVAINEFGKPADIRGEVRDSKGRRVAVFDSYHQGMGAFDLLPDAGEQYTAHILQPEGIKETYKLPFAIERGYSLRASVNKDFIEVKVNSSENEPLILAMQERGKIVFSKLLAAKKGETTVNISTTDMPIGIGSLTLFDSKRIPRAERLIFVNSDKQLSINIKTNKEKYAPREKVSMTVEVKDERGLPMPGNFSLAVVDDKLLSFADDKQANILAEILLQSDLKGEIDEPNFYFDKKEDKAPLALDYLMLTHGWRRFDWDKVLQKSVPIATVKAERAILAGQTADIAGAPISNVTVSVKGDKSILPLRTDAAGHFEILGVKLTKPCTLVFSGEGFQQVEKTFYEYNSEIKVVKMTHLTGRVLDGKTKEALAGASVVLYKQNGGGLQYIAGVLGDMEGNFKLPEFVADATSYTLYVSYAGFQTKTIKDVRFDKPLIVNMEGAATLQEVVVTSSAPQRKKLKNASVSRVNVKEIEGKADRAAAAAPPAMAENEKMAENIPRPAPAMPQMAHNAQVIEMEEAPAPAVVFDNVAVGRVESAEELKKLPIKKDDAEVAKQRKGNVALGGEMDQKIVELPVAFGDDVEQGKKEVIAPAKNVELADKRVAMAGKKDFKRGGEQMKIPVVAQASQQVIRYTAVKEFYAPAYTVREAVKSRTDFRKTLYWNPNVQVGRNGRATIEFYASDDVTQFRAIAEGFAVDGGIGRGEAVFFTQLPVQMTVKIPTQVLTGDEVNIPLTVTNNSSESISTKLDIIAPKCFVATTQNVNTLTLNPNESKTAYLTYKVTADSLGKNSFEVYLHSSDGHDDRFTETIKVNPRGFPVKAVFSGEKSGESHDFMVQAAIQGSIKCSVTAHPSTVAEMMSGLESLLHTPGGCFEQTSSSNYPNVMVLDYLHETNTYNQDIEARCKGYLDGGYRILAGYECKTGGFHWWGGATGHETLSAYGLMEFMDMKRVYKVDESIIERAKKFLFSRKDGKGSWLDVGGALHTWVTNSAVRDAYITWAMTEAGFASELKPEIENVIAVAKKEKDPYVVALAALACANAKNENADKLMAILLESQVQDGSFTGLKHSVTASSGHAFVMETTSLAALAMMKTKKGLGKLDAAIGYLKKGKTEFGYGNTQATVLTLKAILEHTKYSKHPAEAGDMVVYIDGKKRAAAHFLQDTKGDIEIAGLERYLTDGQHSIEVRFENCKDALPYEINIAYTTTQPVSQTACKIDVSTKLDKETCKMGETVRLTTVLANKTGEAVPSTMAIIGIPAGLSPQPWQLKEIQEKHIADYYEIFDGYVVLHYASLTPNEKRTINLDLKADIPGYFEAPATAGFLYYTNEFKDWDKPTKIKVTM